MAAPPNQSGGRALTLTDHSIVTTLRFGPMFYSSCGTSCDSGERFCANCGVSPPALPVVSRGREPQIASLGWRIIAVILDFIVVWSVISVIVIVVPRRMLEDGFARKGPAVLIPIGLCMLVLSYYFLLETLFGATPMMEPAISALR